MIAARRHALTQDVCGWIPEVMEEMLFALIGNHSLGFLGVVHMDE